MQKLYFLLVVVCSATFPCFSQVDTEFWFAPPEVTQGHGDRPVYIRISTLDQPANIQVLLPAKGNLQIAQVNAAANTTQTIDLTNQLSLLETYEPAKVLQTGIRIISSSPVTAYYEVGAPFNAEIFALKGKNALGNKFVIPVQDYYHNSTDYFPTPYFSFDIVATQNNTVIKVWPTKPLFGYPQGGEILVKLNAGETYSFRKLTTSAFDNPGGTIVEANKPIAITLKDDSVIKDGCRDVMGDQLVPVEVAGSEYIVLKGFLGSPEFLFITATEDNTNIFIEGSSVPVARLNAGELYRHLITSQSTYIQATKTIYVLHVTGFGCEVGMAVLPSINCKGSQQIGFSRTTTEFFGLNVLVRKEGINSFRLNGSSALIPPSVFSSVPGTNDQWYAAQLSFTTTQIPVGQASLISNNQYSFQVGIINGNATSSCRYGYFSAFSTLFIGDDIDICEGQTISIDAGPGKESYQWSTGSTEMKIDVADPGTYWVRVEKEECILYDTINVTVKKGNIDLGPDAQFCEGDTAKVDGKENFSWLWSDGSTERYLNTKQAGKHWVSVFDYTGCQASDTIVLSTKPKPPLDLGNDIIKCPTEEVTLNVTYPGATYLWEDGTAGPQRQVKESGIYWCKLTHNGCTSVDSLIVENLPGPPQDSIFGSPSVCPFVKDVNYYVEESPNANYQWIVKGGTMSSNNGSSIKIDWDAANPTASVKALITDELGCKGDTILFPVRINVLLEVEVPIGPDTLCLNKSSQVLYTTPDTNGSIYNWFISGGEIEEGQGTNQIILNWNEGLNKLWIEETSTTIDTVCSGTSPELLVYVFKDETALRFNFASVDTVEESRGKIGWSILGTDRIKNDSVYLYKKISSAIDWQLLSKLPAHITSFTDEGNDTDNNIYDYYVSLTNLCDEPVTSIAHSTIRLTASVDTLTDLIHFKWNKYEGWSQGVDHYQLWRKLDDESGYKLFSSIPGTENTFSSVNTTAGFMHTYVIRAVEEGGQNDSWSNNVGFEFTHDIFVPNVFTPNDDEYNQYFEIKKIELYKDSELRVVNRWGKTIFEAKGYKNDWNGGDLGTGVYYFVLDLKRNDKVFKGTISILR